MSRPFGSERVQPGGQVELCAMREARSTQDTSQPCPLKLPWKGSRADGRGGVLTRERTTRRGLRPGGTERKCPASSHTYIHSGAVGSAKAPPGLSVN